MRCSFLPVLGLLAALLVPGSALAQKAKRTMITGEPAIRIGFQAGLAVNEVGGKEYLFKPGFWAPAAVDIIVGDEPLPLGELSVETGDPEDVENIYTVKLPPLAPQQAITVPTYVKVGSRSSDIIIRLTNNGTEVTQRKQNFDAMPVEDLLFIAIGNPLPNLRAALLKQSGKDRDNNNFDRQQMNQGFVARVESVKDMPRHWFGYQGADVALLTTSNADFVKELINDKPRHQALTEWVARGGKLVISAGRNSDLLPALAPEVIEAADTRKLARIKVVPGGLQPHQLFGLSTYVKQGTAVLEGLPAKAGDASGPIALANFQRKPGKDIEVLADAGDRDNHPILVRIPYGTGQIILAAWDLDQAPFKNWVGEFDFWKHLQVDLGVPLTVQQNPGYGNFGNADNSNDIASGLYSSLQSFPEVSNISFGWVALFIFVYILVVGPLDYFFLKKVVKRLELTWITFPSVVLIVSVVAYFTAYALKGNDLLINKADLVDIDLEGQTAYGRTWFTLFSPRIQYYTIGLEPAAPMWTRTPGEDDKASTVLMSWMGRPGDGFGAFGRSRSQSLFRRSYSYAPEATGLEGVPIQVWTMKTFEGSWVRPLDPDKPPLVADLSFGGEGGRQLQGTITNQLPVNLVDVHLIYSGQNKDVYSLGKPLVSDVPQRIVARQTGTVSDWLNNRASQPMNVGPGQRQVSGKEDIFKRIEFFQIDNRQAQNVTLRNLDSSWRLRLKNEVILVARVAQMQGNAEKVTADAVSPSRLWLGKLPSANDTRPSLLGNLTQDTYVRVFIPVKAAEKDR
jgi:hypothetical protein